MIKLQFYHFTDFQLSLNMAENARDDTFRRRLFEKFEKNPNYLLPKTKYQEIIYQLKATLGVARKTARQYKLLSRSVLVVVVVVDWLVGFCVSSLYQKFPQ